MIDAVQFLNFQEDNQEGTTQTPLNIIDESLPYYFAASLAGSGLQWCHKPKRRPFSFSQHSLRRTMLRSVLLTGLSCHG